MIENRITATGYVVSGSYAFRVIKRLIDILFCTILIPILFLTTIVVMFLNIFFNRGKLYFIQKRMGKNCEPFYVIKFRTMRGVKVIERKYTDPLETDRVTKLGYLLRKTKIDELPQILNVLKGEMSLIGPRPDYYEHALSFLQQDPLYRYRYSVRPGISGLSQIRLGYAEGLIATKKKSKIDEFYIKNASIKLDMQIFFATLLVILKGFFEQ